MSRHLYLAAYDISEDHRRCGALKRLKGVATGGQKSVHEIWLTEAEKRMLLADMEFILGCEDRFLLLRLDTRGSVLTLGRARAPADPDYFYIG
jgi:CRISPR-associated protein Cas2